MDRRSVDDHRVGAGADQEISAVRSDLHPASRGGALLVDVGTTMTKLALAHGDELVRVDAFPTGAPGAGGWEARFGAAITSRVADGSIATIAIAAPRDVVGRLRAWWTTRHVRAVPIQVVDAATAPLAIDYRPPSALGPDRLANAVAAVSSCGAPVIVVDVGTAITCDLVSAGGRFVGGAIAPGPLTSYAGLVARAPHLAIAAGLALEDDLPLTATSTGDAVRVGVLQGAAALIDSLVATYRTQVGSCPVIMTGGLGPTVARHCTTITAIDPDLTLRGIHLVGVGVVGRPAVDARHEPDDGQGWGA